MPISPLVMKLLNSLTLLISVFLSGSFLSDFLSDCLSSDLTDNQWVLILCGQIF